VRSGETCQQLQLSSGSGFSLQSHISTTEFILSRKFLGQTAIQQKIAAEINVRGPHHLRTAIFNGQRSYRANLSPVNFGCAGATFFARTST
jgi:hypothetical protein